jgi:MATE family multidrug resistance protein
MTQQSVQPESGRDVSRPSISGAAAPAVSPMAELLRIAGPTVATMTSYTLMQFVDKWMVSRIGPDPVYVGAQGNGGLAAFVPISIAMGLLTIINTYVSQNMGAGRPQRGPAYAWNGLWIAAAYWLVLLVPYGVLLPRVFAATGMDAEQARLGATYGQILVFGSILTMWTRAVSQFFYGMHRAGIVMIAGIAANVINLGLNYLLIFGQFGLPRMGVAGSAIGTVIATGVELAIPMAFFLSTRLNALYQTRSQWRLSRRHLRELLTLGWPAGLMFGNEMVCWGYFMVYLVSHFGREHATAGWIAHQYMSLSFMPAVGISVACTAVVGKYMGAGRPDLAERRAWLALKLAMAYMLACGVVFVLFRADLVRLFIQSDTPPATAAELVRLGSMFLIATAAFQAFDAIAMTTSGALRGAGDTVVPGVLTLVLSWTVIVGGGTLIIHVRPELESLGPWISAAAYIVLLSLLLLSRFLSGRWKTRRLIEPPAATRACTQCGYDLLGLPPDAGLCPECGASVGLDPSARRTSASPTVPAQT